jgi:hypothetical protein
LRATRQLRFTLSPSRRLAGIVLVVHAAAALSAAIALPRPFGSLLAVLLLGLGAMSAWERALLRSARSIRAIEVFETGDAVLERADGVRQQWQVARRRHVSRYGVSIAPRRGAAIPIFIASDMLDAAAFRALRVWALWDRLPRLSPARQEQ